MAQHKMTFEVENGLTKAKIDGIYMGGGKAASMGGKEYTAGEGIAISDEGVISLDIADGDEEGF